MKSDILLIHIQSCSSDVKERKGMSIKSATCKETRIRVINPLENTNNAVLSEAALEKYLSIRKGGKPQNSSKPSGILTIHILRNSVSGLKLSKNSL